MIMDFYSSTDAKREFGDILIKSQRNPIDITRNGKHVAVILSEQDYIALKALADKASQLGLGNDVLENSIKHAKD